MKKSDLKNGMIVEIRTGEKYLVHNDKLLSDNLVGHLSLNEELLGYDDDLREANNVKIYDIMKVYESPSESISTFPFKSPLEPFTKPNRESVAVDTS